MIRRTVVSPVVAALIAAAAAIPVAHSATTTRACTQAAVYPTCGRAFPDPEAGLGRDPNAEGRFPATDFIQFGTPGSPGGSEIWDGLKLLEARFPRFLKVWTLEDFLDDPEAKSAGLWIANQRIRSPLIMVRVTDEAVSAADKERFVFALSLHGIERAGVEGGTRAIEDLATYAYCESLGDLATVQTNPICALQNQVQRGAFREDAGGFPAHLLPSDEHSLTMGQTLARAELYFTYNNPDGWHRGDKPAAGGLGTYQRYNGNGVDPNREWPTEGFTFAPYTPSSEPETDAFARALRSISDEWTGGIDLHGMHFAPTLTYTMLPAGQNDFRKNARIRAVAERTQADALARLAWSPLIDSGQGTPRVQDFFFGQVIPMKPQLWGTVWDTLDYTITGALGDWINSRSVGLGGIGMDNEMALSHISNCGVGSCFVPEVEQLHVAGNKGLIYADLDTVLRTVHTDYAFPFDARGAYVRHDKVIAETGETRALGTRPNLHPQTGFTGQIACATGPVTVVPCVTDPFEIQGADVGVGNGGITVDFAFAAPYAANDEFGGDFALQRFTADHGDGGEWVDVASNYTAGQTYLPNGVTVAANDPVPGTYRLRVRPSTPGVYFFDVRFKRAHAFEDPPPRDVRATNLDFFDELNRYLPRAHRFDGLDARAIIDDPRVLDAYDVLVLPDDALPGWVEPATTGTVGPGRWKPFPERQTLTATQRDAYYEALKAWVKRGGTLVLTDAALQALAPLTGNAKLGAAVSTEYAGFAAFDDYRDPLARGVNVPGAAEGSGARHQTYEPVPLGFDIGDGFIPASQNSSPSWTLDRSAFEKAGGRTVAHTSRGTSVGELSLGDGSIRFAGALLPTPTDRFDHPFGLASYALTYTGWQVFENLVAVPGKTVRPVPTKVLGARHTLADTGVGHGSAGLLLLLLAGALTAAARGRSHLGSFHPPRSRA